LIAENDLTVPVTEEHTITSTLDDFITDAERPVTYRYGVTSTDYESAVVTFQLSSGDQDAAKIEIQDSDGNVVAKQGFVGGEDTNNGGTVTTQLRISNLQPDKDYSYKVVVSSGVTKKSMSSAKDSEDFNDKDYT
jgi:phosphodiesterase/alkaline phosphatase D-like protein